MELGHCQNSSDRTGCLAPQIYRILPDLKSGETNFKIDFCHFYPLAGRGFNRLQVNKLRVRCEWVSTSDVTLWLKMSYAKMAKVEPSP